MWFLGNVANAVEQSRREKKLLMVFIEGSDETSKKMSDVFTNLSQDTLSFVKETMICVRVEHGSENCNRFSEIYGIVIVPSLYFITINGINLDIILGAVSESDFKCRADNVLIAHQKCVSGQASQGNQKTEQKLPSGNSSQLLSNPVQSSSEGPNDNSGAKFGEKVAKAKQLLNEVRNKMKEEEAAKTKKVEKERIQMGKEIQKARSRKEELEMAEAIKEREKEKREAAEAKMRVLAQIAADKEERKRRNELFRTTQESKPQEPETSCQKRPKLDSNQSRIQFKLANGSSISGIFNATDKFTCLVDHVTNNSPYKNFTLSLTYPKRVFGPEDLNKSLNDLELIPSAVILVIPSSSPVNKVTSVVSSSFFTQVWSLFLTPLLAVWAFVMRLISPNAPPSTPDPRRLEERKREAEEQARRVALRQREGKLLNREGNIARLQDNRENSEDDDNTWNGNSTQQM